ncbi:MAG: sulfatase, partial [Gemmatimonadaceae bacterium]
LSLASEGTTFNWAFSTASWTLPSHASMFTGRYASQHSGDFRSALDDRYPTIAEVMAARGYRTGGFTANLVATTTAVGLQRGFSRYEDYRLTSRQLLLSTMLGQATSLRQAERNLFEQRWIGGAVKSLLKLDLQPEFVSPDNHQKPAELILHSFLDWRRTDAKRPYFAFLNFFDAHAPYVSPTKYQSMFVDGTLMARYDRSIRYIDDQLAVLFDTLRTRGELDNTIVVIAADHGEQLGEHGLQGHANSLYQQAVHVPLLIRYPSRVPAGKRIDRQVSLRDLAATITDLAATKGETGLQGTSLASVMSGTGSSSDALQELSKVPLPSPSHRNGKGSMYAITDDSLHFIRSGDGRLEIFDYRNDTEEAHDLSSTLRALVPRYEEAHSRILRGTRDVQAKR